MALWFLLSVLILFVLDSEYSGHWFLCLFTAGVLHFFIISLDHFFSLTKAKEHKKFFLSRGFLVVWSQGSEYKKGEWKSSRRSIRVFAVVFLSF